MMMRTTAKANNEQDVGPGVPERNGASRLPLSLPPSTTAALVFRWFG